MSDFHMRLTIEWTDPGGSATEYLMAYGAECAAELGLEDPDSAVAAFAAIVSAHGFEGLWERFGPYGTEAPHSFAHYAVTPL